MLQTNELSNANLKFFLLCANALCGLFFCVRLRRLRWALAPPHPRHTHEDLLRSALALGGGASRRPLRGASPPPPPGTNPGSRMPQPIGGPGVRQTVGGPGVPGSPGSAPPGFQGVRACVRACLYGHVTTDK